MFVQVTAKNVGNVFVKHSVYNNDYYYELNTVGDVNNSVAHEPLTCCSVCRRYG